jgi:CBS domain-containing protein
MDNPYFVEVEHDSTRKPNVHFTWACWIVLGYECYYRVHATETGGRRVLEGLDILRAAQNFLENRFRRIAVVDDGKQVGQITHLDIVKGTEKYF